jgi:hypothetical protein
MKWFYGIITDGSDNALLERVVDAINNIKGPDDEIAICGYTDNLDLSVHSLISAPDLARDGRLGAMRNALIDQHGDADIVVTLDDDIILGRGFVEGFDKIGYNWDVASCVIHNPDDTRYWDWKVHRNGLNWLIPYDETSRDISITGGLVIAKSDIYKTVCWNPSLGFYEQEDVEFSNLLRRQDYKIVFNPHSSATHMGPYTQIDDGVFRTDL